MAEWEPDQGPSLPGLWSSRPLRGPFLRTSPHGAGTPRIHRSESGFHVAARRSVLGRAHVGPRSPHLSGKQLWTDSADQAESPAWCSGRKPVQLYPPPAPGKTSKTHISESQVLLSEKDVPARSLSWDHRLTAWDPVDTPHPSLVCSRAPCPHTPRKARVLCWRTKFTRAAHTPPSVVTSPLSHSACPPGPAQLHGRASLAACLGQGTPARLVSAVDFSCCLRLGSAESLHGCKTDTSCPCPTVPRQLGFY